MAAPFDPTQHIVAYTIIRPIVPQNTVPSGECGIIRLWKTGAERRYFRGDAAFANPEIYEFLEAEGMGYAIRLPANRVLQDKIGYQLKRPAGRPPHEVRRYYASFSYQAQSWKKARKVVAKVDPGTPGRFSPSAQSIGGFDHLPAQRAILPLPKTPEGTILAHYHRESGECRFNAISGSC
jgi:hypothetical protein